MKYLCWNIGGTPERQCGKDCRAAVKALLKYEILTLWSHESTRFCYFSSTTVSNLGVVIEKIELVYLSGFGVFLGCCDKDRILRILAKKC